MWLRKKTQNLPTSYTSSRLNPHDQLGRLCVYGIYKRTLRAPTKENALVLIAWTLEARTHRSRTRSESELHPQQVQRSAVLEGILGGEVDCDSQLGKGLWQQWLRKSIYYYVLTHSVDSLDFFSFFFLFYPISAIAVNFIGTMKSN